MPVTVVPTSFATVAIETFITELSSVIRNWLAARVRRTSVAPAARADDVGSALSIRRVSTRRPGRGRGRCYRNQGRQSTKLRAAQTAVNAATTASDEPKTASATAKAIARASVMTAHT